MRLFSVSKRQNYLEVFGQEQLAGPQEAEDVAEDVSVSVDEVVLLQTVQHDGLRAVKQTTDPAETQEGRTAESSLQPLTCPRPQSSAVLC